MTLSKHTMKICNCCKHGEGPKYCTRLLSSGFFRFSLIVLVLVHVSLSLRIIAQRVIIHGPRINDANLNIRDTLVRACCLGTGTWSETTLIQ